MSGSPVSAELGLGTLCLTRTTSLRSPSRAVPWTISGFRWSILPIPRAC